MGPDIGEVTGTPLNFPIVADPDHRIAELYDMIHPGEGDTSTVRSVFIVDPDNKLRLMLTYPKSVGRNFDEIVRVIDALQATDANPIATPADWRPGDRVIVAMAVSTEDAKTQFDNVEEFKPYLRYADAPPVVRGRSEADPRGGAAGFMSDWRTGNPSPAERPSRSAPPVEGSNAWKSGCRDGVRPLISERGRPLS